MKRVLLLLLLLLFLFLLVTGLYSTLENMLNLKHQLTHQTIFTSFYLVEINEWPLLFPQAKIIAIKDLEQYAVAKPTTLFLQKLQQKLLNLLLQVDGYLINLGLKLLFA